MVELMISANQYVLLPLQEQCEAFIEQVSLVSPVGKKVVGNTALASSPQGLSAENAGYFLEMANRFQAQHLKALALEYMVQHRAEFESVRTRCDPKPPLL